MAFMCDLRLNLTQINHQSVMHGDRKLLIVVDRILEYGFLATHLTYLIVSS